MSDYAKLCVKMQAREKKKIDLYRNGTRHIKLSGVLHQLDAIKTIFADSKGGNQYLQIAMSGTYTLKLSRVIFPFTSIRFIHVKCIMHINVGIITCNNDYV